MPVQLDAVHKQVPVGRGRPAPRIVKERGQALLQICARMRMVVSSWLSSCFKFEPFVDKLDRLGDRRRAEAEGALEDAGSAAYVARDVEG